MHDPCTVAFEIKYPWVHRRTTWADGSVHAYHDPFITIWHVDPERRGDDDSCGWFNRKDDKSNAICTEARKIGEAEWKFMCGEFGYEMTPFEMVYTAWRVIAWRQFKRLHIGVRELDCIISLSTSPSDNLRWRADEARESEKAMGGLFYRVAAAYLRLHRPWWDHPRWHVWHWRIQCHPLQDLKRFLFSRCAGCGKRFTWGYAPISTQWGGDGPRWFRGERSVYHDTCVPNSVPAKASE